jgi:heme/copper-type cytochrome/quinol oxidase subunit 2
MQKTKTKYFTLNRVKSKATVPLTLLFLWISKSPAYANAISDSPIGKGLVKMFNDASVFLLILSPITGGLFALYFLIRKNAADEQDQKQWNKRLITTGVCVVGAVLVSVVINLVTGYFQPTTAT